jgi:protein-disulfide isomerase
MTALFRPFALAALLLASLSAAGPLAAAEPTPADVDYLNAHPEVIIDAIQKYQDKQAAAQAAKARASIAELQGDLLKDPASPVGGNPDGDVTIVEFFDYRCPYCKAVAPDLAKALAADGRVRLIYKEFPILGPASVTASKAALAARAQDKYIPFHEKLIAYKGNLDDAKILELAADVGLDVTRLKADMETADVKDAINRNYKLAEKLDIQGTPAFVIGNELLPGAASVDELTAAVKRARSGG